MSEPGKAAMRARFEVRFEVPGPLDGVVEAYDRELGRRVALRRLLPARRREAQALAALAHPNLLAIYGVHDAGGGDLVLSSELGDGAPLDAWLARPRPWRDVVALFIGAGRGLDAAHRAGVTHGAFGPAAVQVGLDGRPRVGGLGATAPAAGGGGDGDGDGARDLDAEIRADVRAFRAALARALPAGAPRSIRRALVDDDATLRTGGRRALEDDDAALGARTARSIPRAVADDDQAVPAGAPRSIRRALTGDDATRRTGGRRALADADAALGALLDRLERGLGARRRRAVVALAAAAVTAAVMAVVVAAGGREAVEPCAAPIARADEVWGAVRRAGVARRLVAIDPVRGAQRFAAAAAVLDRGFAAWREMHVEACRATRVDEVQPDAVLDLRMGCLEDWRRRAAARVAALEGAADPRSLDGVLERLGGVGAVERCGEVALLKAVAPPLVDPAAAAEVAAIRDELSAIEAAAIAGPPPDLVARAGAALERARGSGDAAVIAAALAVCARLARQVGDTAGTIAYLRDLTGAAAIARDDERAAAAWAELAQMLAEREGKRAEALALLPAARTASARIGDPPPLLAQVLHFESRVRAAANDPDAADAAADRAARLLDEAGAAQPGSPLASQRLELVFARADRHFRAARYDAAAADARRAIAIADTIYGPDTIATGTAHLLLGQALHEAGDAGGAIAALREAARIREARTGASATTGNALMTLARSLARRDRAEAIALGERALAMQRAALAPDDAALVRAYDLLGEIHAGDRSGLARATALYDEAIARAERAGVDDTSHLELQRAALLHGAGRLAEADAGYRRAGARAERFDPTGRRLAVILRHHGLCLAYLGRHAEAIAALERSFAHAPPPAQRDLATFARGVLGRLLVATGRDRARGRAMLREARAELRVARSPYLRELEAS